MECSSRCVFPQITGNCLSCNHLQFLTQFGTRIALRNDMNSEMNPTEASCSPALANPGLVILDRSGVGAMRHCLHELANVFTGVMLSSGLLCQYLEGGSLQHYATDIAEGGERGCALVRELRRQLLAACSEAEAASPGNADASVHGQQGNLFI